MSSFSIESFQQRRRYIEFFPPKIFSSFVHFFFPQLYFSLSNIGEICIEITTRHKHEKIRNSDIILHYEWKYYTAHIRNGFWCAGISNLFNIENFSLLPSSVRAQFEILLIFTKKKTCHTFSTRYDIRRACAYAHMAKIVYDTNTSNPTWRMNS